MWWSRKKRGTALSLPGGATVRHDADEDIATIVLSDKPVAETKRYEGIGLVDFAEDGDVVAIEVFRFSESLPRIEKMRREREAATRTLEEDLRASATRLVEEVRERMRVT